ncbi:dNA polymerase III subunit gamma/tau [Clostridium sp. CAG:575]|nr:dNA polymerase III subunit gamma/tau [Clostridium sp. CAG:575]
MGYTALYRKFRPITFSELVGQEHITRTLRNQIVADRVGHAYLFNGGRGTGKTSSAKILARAINCLHPIDGEPCNECEICKAAINGSLTDIVEMDAASNNSVEDIRSIREEVNFLPTKAKYRVYIIDEVHMLSPGAFNALLKTLEEPPEHVKFILATTEPQKLPATILSRCQRFDFKRISNEDIIKRLKIVCEESNIEITEGALNIISVLAEGAMRDALSILERCIQDGENKIDEDKIKDLVGIPKITYVHNIIDAIVEYNIDNALEAMDAVINEGKDLDNFLWEMIKYVKDVLVYKSSKKADLYSEEETEKIKSLSEKASKDKLVYLIYELSNLENDMKWSTQKTIMFQAGMIKLCSKEVGTSGTLEERIEKIENYLKSGKIQVATQNFGTQGTQNLQGAYQAVPMGNVSGQRIQQNGITQPQIGADRPQSQMANNSRTRNNIRATTSYSSDLSKSWPKIVNDLKQNGRIVLYTNLLDTRAEEINDMTVGIKFPKGITAFGKTILEKQENIKEISTLVSMACGKPMNIKYIPENQNNMVQHNPQDDIAKLANESDIPFNVIE